MPGGAVGDSGRVKPAKSNLIGAQRRPRDEATEAATPHFTGRQTHAHFRICPKLPAGSDFPRAQLAIP
jgi:hypothetical protein